MTDHFHDRDNVAAWSRQQMASHLRDDHGIRTPMAWDLSHQLNNAHLKAHQTPVNQPEETPVPESAFDRLLREGKISNQTITLDDMSGPAEEGRVCGAVNPDLPIVTCTYSLGHNKIVDPLIEPEEEGFHIEGTFDHGNVPGQVWWTDVAEKGTEPEAVTGVVQPPTVSDQVRVLEEENAALREQLATGQRALERERAALGTRISTLSRLLDARTQALEEGRAAMFGWVQDLRAEAKGTPGPIYIDYNGQQVIDRIEKILTTGVSTAEPDEDGKSFYAAVAQRVRDGRFREREESPTIPPDRMPAGLHLPRPPRPLTVDLPGGGMMRLEIIE